MFDDLVDKLFDTVIDLVRELAYGFLWALLTITILTTFPDAPQERVLLYVACFAIIFWLLGIVMRWGAGLLVKWMPRLAKQ